ncbi:MAG TPA: DUF99 family protein [Candidatus Bathyarchaeota archaeon]|nr:DUF99 family protein [Candidatus Bathyarchaeota archaeon]
MRYFKKGIRALGVAECFKKGASRRSILAGVVVRADMLVDGFSFATATVGGLDATEAVVRLYERLRRKDVNLLMLNGCVISWYNVIDLHEVADRTGKPLICVTYEPSPGLEKYFAEYFPRDWRERLAIYERNGPRKRVRLKTGHEIFIRAVGLEEEEALKVLDRFVLHGAIPEPLRLARLLARATLASVDELSQARLADLTP